MPESFVERTVPPRRPAGPVIPTGVRDVLLAKLVEHGVSPREIWRLLALDQGYGSVGDVAEDIDERWGQEDAYAFLSAAGGASFSGVGVQAATILRHVPEPLLLDALQHALGLLIPPDFFDTIAVINRLFEKRGIAYRFTENGQAEWHGGEGAYREVIRPALDVLDDDRLDACRGEFVAALGHLRAGTARDREDAIEEAGKAVESAMKVLLAARGVERTGNETAEPLWNLLRDNGIVPPKTKDAILAPSRLRNEYGGHGAGEAVREIPEEIPELAVRVAAAAIAYLGGLLP